MPNDPTPPASTQPRTQPTRFVLTATQRAALLNMLGNQPFKIVAPFVSMLDSLPDADAPAVKPAE